MEEKPKVYIEKAGNLTKDGIKAIREVADLEEKPKKELPMNYMVNEFMNQQLTTLNKSEEEKNDDANANGRTTSEKHLEGDSRGTEDPDSELREESVDDQGPT